VQILIISARTVLDDTQSSVFKYPLMKGIYFDFKGLRKTKMFSCFLFVKNKSYRLCFKVNCWLVSNSSRASFRKYFFDKVQNLLF
jgi:hypothetical protein